MDDGRVVCVHVQQTIGHVLQDGQLDGEGDVGARVQAVAEVHLQTLHDHRQVAQPLLVVHSNEMHNVRMAEFAQQHAFCSETPLSSDFLMLRQLIIQCEGVDVLSDAKNSVHSDTIRRPVRAGAYPVLFCIQSFHGVY